MNCLAYMNRRYLGRKVVRGVHTTFTWVEPEQRGRAAASSSANGVRQAAPGAVELGAAQAGLAV
jgi:hypothetical protein